MSDAPWARFRNLCAYYIDCVRYSEKRQEYLFVDQLNNSCLLPALPPGWHLCKNGFAIETSREQLPARNALLTADAEDEIFIGYPLTSFYSPRGTHCLCPILLFPVEVQVLGPGRTSGLRLQIDRQGIDINRDWVEFHVPRDQQQLFLRACERVSDTMGAIDVDCALQFIANQFKIVVDPNRMDFSMRHEDARRGILNTAALFIGSKTKYTRNLIRELTQIQNEPDAVLDKTALAYVFRNPALENRPAPHNEQKLPIPFTKTPLNAAQYEAIGDALNTPVVKVTGPPGTGKSHLSVNLIANEVFYGGSALFTSKNHKAIHAIFDESQSMFPGTDFGLVDFCTAPGATSGVRWDGYAEAVCTRTGLARIHVNRSAGEERWQVPEQIRSPALADVAKALDEFRDAKQHLERYQQLRETLSNYENLLVRIDALLKVPDRERDSPEFQKLLERSIRILEDDHRLTRWECFLRLLRTWLGRNKIEVDIRSQLNMLVPGLAQVFSSRRSVARSTRKLLELLRYRLLVKGWELSEIDAVRAEMGQCRYDVLKDALRGALAVILREAGDAYIDRLTTRIVGIAEPDGLLARIKAELRLRGDAPLAFMTSIGTAERYDKVLAAFREFHKLFPAWAVTMLSLKHAAPCLPGIFSLAIIDEASQCEIPPMIPVLFRASRIAIVGDPNQFPPVITMDKRRNEALRIKYALQGPEYEKFSFIGNNAFSILPARAHLLVEHFRCVDEIAAYFNDEFYKHELCPCVGDRAQGHYDAFGIRPGLDWVEAPGGDEAEIEAALGRLRQMRASGFRGTIGIISPLRSVANEIRTRAYQHKDELPVGLDIDQHINTANGFQGGQCDVILFLLGLNPSRKHGEAWYILSDENKYIYNVSVSRARICCIVIGDQKAALATGLPRIMRLVPNRDAVSRPIVGYGEPILQKALEQAGFHPMPQYPVCNRWLDLALPKEKIDIEVDGLAFHLDRNGCRKADDIHRDLLLELAGWTVVRVWHYEVMQDVDGCVTKIKAIAEARQFSRSGKA